MMNMLKLKHSLVPGGAVVRYKDYVVAVEFLNEPFCEYFTAQIWAPIETEEETGLEFCELRLEDVTPWEPLTLEACWDTEGEALFAAMQAVEVLEC